MKGLSQSDLARMARSSVLDFLFVAFGFALPLVSWIALSYPPTIISQGQAHRIFYIHVPIAWVALYAPLLSAVSGILYLRTREQRFDLWSLASNRISLLFAAAVVISGPLWASTEWGTYWNWKDSRLMSFFILLLSLVGYFYARSSTERPDRKAVVGAVMSILTSISAVLTWLAIRVVTPDTHPESVMGTMAPPIRITFWISVLGYHFLFLAFLRLAIRREYLTALFEKTREY
ncbi:MAG TPA: cytochrome c biogenesis protein [Leptospiraceae bacterium]|nr:cytochrome c biogenesis protein CcsA [Leptospirales bacterium]HMU83373.1 cytochrome c biogenesis protein [Leptospiraceae bacterium]HMX58773.1 cytochrome c biogenesis protein [Leptospiraceae bacterium]HMY44125.1 cytochrome c biogenesis protein [Leptospiraceae bacterium]HMZ37793.1 cytochrome c biogenesis protein [Leptospiraceae bacterium]